jgi:large subunit ribosomal protein L32
MPVPKKRLGRSDQGHRRAHWKASIINTVTCSNCGAPRLPHTVCGSCGFYRGRVVSERFNKLAKAAASEE